MKSFFEYVLPLATVALLLIGLVFLVSLPAPIRVRSSEIRKLQKDVEQLRGDVDYLETQRMFEVHR